MKVKEKAREIDIAHLDHVLKQFEFDDIHIDDARSQGDTSVDNDFWEDFNLENDANFGNIPKINVNRSRSQMSHISNSKRKSSTQQNSQRSNRVDLKTLVKAKEQSLRRPIITSGLTRHEYLTHLSTIRLSHNIIFKNYRMSVLSKAGELIDKKLVAMKKATEEEVQRIYDRMNDIITKYRFSETKEQEQTPEKNELNEAREINRKLKKFLGFRFVNERQKEDPNFSEDLEKYTQRFLKSNSKRVFEEFYCNLFRFEQQQPDEELVKLRRENLHKEDIIQHLQADNYSLQRTLEMYSQDIEKYEKVIESLHEKIQELEIRNQHKDLKEEIQKLEGHVEDTHIDYKDKIQQIQKMAETEMKVRNEIIRQQMEKSK